MSPIFNATWILCGLSSAVFPLAARARSKGIVIFVLSFILSARFILLGGTFDPSSLAVLVSAAALLQLLRPRFWIITVLAAGISSGFSAYGLVLQGTNVWLAFMLALIIPVAAYALSSRKAFAPESMRDEALLGLFLLGLLLSVGPALTEGWRSALALNIQGGAGTNNIFPMWVLISGGISIALGGWYSLWRRN